MEDDASGVGIDTPEDEEEAVVEDANPTDSALKTKKVVGKWEHINSQPPLWMRYVFVN